MRARNWPPCWMRFGCRGRGGTARATAQTGCSPTKATAIRPAGGCCGGGIRSVIPTRPDQRQRPFARGTYRRRNVVERCVNRLKQFHSLATRDEKRAANYRALVVIAALVIWLV